MKHDQLGGTCITASGRFSSFVMEVGVNTSGLGRWSWLNVGGGWKMMCLITAYQPCNPGKRTRGETVWDQQVRYFEAQGEIRDPRVMFKADLLYHL
jgi:hypothetical protein